MKKLIAALLTLVLLAGIVPATLAMDDQVTSATPKTIKALVLGDQNTRSGIENLYKTLVAEGYEPTLGLLYGRNYGVESFSGGLANETPPTFTFNRNERDFWESAAGFSVKAALDDRDWDYVILNASVSRMTDTNALADALNTLVSFIKSRKPNVKIGWHVNWSAEMDQAAYAKSAETAQKLILNSGVIDFVVPVGTVVMNMQTSFMDQPLHKDYRTLSRGVDSNGHVNLVVGESGDPNMNELGELIAGYAWYAALTGNKVEDLKYAEEYPVYLSSAEHKVILEAISNAMAKPYTITKSAYAAEPTQYTVMVNGKPEQYMAGDTVTITAKAQTNSQCDFLNWNVEKGGVSLADDKALTTTFKMPAQDVEVKAVYEADDQNVGTLQVGFGRVDVTPDERNFPEGVTGINMAGNSSTGTRISTGRLTDDDALNVTAIALSDGTRTNVIMTHDFIRVPTGWADQVQDLALEKYGLPKDCLSMSATHTHSAVDIGDTQGTLVVQGAKQVTSVPGSKNYWYFLVWRDGVLDAIGQALEDLSPVSQTQAGSVDVPGAINVVRHWRYSDATMAGSNFTNTGGAVKGRTEDADPELQLVRFVRDDKQDVVLVNWQAHPTGFGQDYADGIKKLSADFCGVVYRTLEAKDKDCLAAYFSGACANLNTSQNMGTVREKYGYTEQDLPISYIGETLAKYATELMDHLTVVDTDGVKSMRVEHIAIERGYASSRTIQQDVVAVGDSIAFVTAGYEMYDTNGEYVKDNSPYAITFVMENSQGHEYMPDWQACHYTLLGGPVAYEAKSGCFNEVPGTAEDLADGLVGMLNVLYES